MRRLLALTLLLASCGGKTGGYDPMTEPPVQQTGPVEQYGFVARLGNDTVSVESVSKSANALISYDVDQFPLVRIRHTELEIAPDGRLTRMVMDTKTPSGTTPAKRWRRVVARFTNDSVKVTVTDSSGTSAKNFAHEGALTVPHISMLYSVIEFEIASSIARAVAAGIPTAGPLPFRQFYPDRDVSTGFVLHRGKVFSRGNGVVELQHDWLAGPADVTIDSAGRMLTYSGKRTTYLVDVVRTAELPDIGAIGAAFTAREQQAGAKQLSVRDTTRATIGKADILVDYGRPLARGRVLLGNVIKYDRIWRTGANEATQLIISAPIMLGGVEVPAGSYSLWTAPHERRIELIINKQFGQWGTSYDPKQDLGYVTLGSEAVTTPVEKFTIKVLSADAAHGTLVFEWGDFRWTAPIVVK